MISKDDIANFIKRPELVDCIDYKEIEELIGIYPFCEMLHWIFLRALYVQNNAIFEDELLKHGMYISNRRVFFEYMTFSVGNEAKEVVPEGLINIAPVNYFDVENNPKQKQTLKALAEKLRKARLEKLNAGNVNVVPEKFSATDNIALTTSKESVDSSKYDEDRAEFLIKNGKYSEALEILRAINLNNPKKSVYFALQIKFLETIINNNNKIN